MRGDEGTELGELVAAARRLARAWARSRPVDPEECVAQALLVLAELLANPPAAIPVGARFCRILPWRLMDWQRTQVREWNRSQQCRTVQQVPLPDEQADRVAGPGGDRLRSVQDDGYERVDHDLTVAAAVRHLSPKQAHVVRALYEGATYAEAGGGRSGDNLAETRAAHLRARAASTLRRIEFIAAE